MCQAIVAVTDELGADTVHLDQTLLTRNTQNGRVEGLTTIEGSVALHRQLRALRPQLVVQGEGLNEITVGHEEFAQAHIYEGWEKPVREFNLAAASPLNDFLWRPNARLTAYLHVFLDAPQADFDNAVELYRRMGAIPTILLPDTKAPDWKVDYSLLTRENPRVQKILALTKQPKTPRHETT